VRYFREWRSPPTPHPFGASRARWRRKLIAERTVHVLGQRVLMRAAEDVKIKGEKVHLA
jgi:hypothetical protein